MDTTIQLGVATIHAEVDDSMWVEYLGDSRWRFLKTDIEKIESHFDMFGSRLYERHEDLDTLEDDDWVEYCNTDSGILILACMEKLGGEWSIEWSGESEYWFFHDVDHAQFDTWVGEKGNSPELTIDSGSQEERALINGAKSALRAGVSLGSVCQQLAKAEKYFEERFGYPIKSLWENALDEFVVRDEEQVST